jgi:hypothetical protein
MATQKEYQVVINVLALSKQDAAEQAYKMLASGSDPDKVEPFYGELEKFRGWTIIRNADGIIALDEKKRNILPAASSHKTIESARQSINHWILCNGDANLWYLLGGQSGVWGTGEHTSITEVDGSRKLTISNIGCKFVIETKPKQSTARIQILPQLEINLNTVQMLTLAVAPERCRKRNARKRIEVTQTLTRLTRREMETYMAWGNGYSNSNAYASSSEAEQKVMARKEAIESGKAKRTKEVFPSGEIAHLWAHQIVAHARNAQRNFYFNGDTIYSYGSHFPIAVRVSKGKGDKKRECVVFTTQKHSVTTAKHLSAVRMAIPSVFDVYEVPFVGNAKELKSAAFYQLAACLLIGC